MSLNHSSPISLALIPGWSMPAEVFTPFATALSKDWPVTLMQWPTELDIWQHKESLINALANQLPEGPVVLVGWSLGGQLATLLADSLLYPLAKDRGFEKASGVSEYSSAVLEGHPWPASTKVTSMSQLQNTLSPHISSIDESLQKKQQLGKVVGLITLASNPCFIAQKNWPYGMNQQTFKAFQQGLSQLPEKTLKEFCLLVAKGAASFRASAKALQQLQQQNNLSYSVLAEGLQLLAQLDTRTLLQQLNCPQLHLFAKQDALVDHQLVEWFLRKEISASCCSDFGHYLVSDVDAVVSQIKQFVAECRDL